MRACQAINLDWSRVSNFPISFQFVSVIFTQIPLLCFSRTGIGLPQLSHVLSPKTETPVFEPDEEMKKLEPGAENRNQKDDKSENEERGPTVGYVTNPVASPRLGSRRTFSLDEDSLLNYSTSISDSIETTESSIQSSKRREECVRIYEKMKNNGCGVKLQTIFR